MGKPNKQSDDTVADSISLHNNPGPSSSSFPMFDEDEDAPELDLDDLPPNYDDALETSETNPMLPPHPSNPSVAAAMRPPVHPGDIDALVVMTDAHSRAQGWVASSLEDPADLERYVRELATVPPRPYIKLVGTHTENKRDSSGKTEKKTITDFDVSVEMTPYLFADAQYRRGWGGQVRVVDDHDDVYRGTILRRRAADSARHIELGRPPAPTLQEWCHRFSASHAGLKCFELKRHVTGLDFGLLGRRLETMVRDTNYRGHLSVRLDVKDDYFEMYNEAKINRWRLTPWIRWFFYLTFLWAFTWPYLFLRTKRWQVVSVDWPFSVSNESGERQYVSISEDQWYNLWAQCICRAVLEKRQKVLDQADLRAAHEAQPAFDSGHSGVDGALSMFRAGMHAMNEVNRQFGWGGDC